MPQVVFGVIFAFRNMDLRQVSHALTFGGATYRFRAEFRPPPGFANRRIKER